jgi:putative ABC transport system permease protein
MLDLRYAIRTLTKSPGFTLAAVLTLALGIGANAALFSVINAVLLRPLPYRDPGRLVTLWESDARHGLDREPVSPPNYLDWRAQTRTLEDAAAYRYWGFAVTGAGEPERVTGARVSASLFPLLGVRLAAGRAFTADEDRFGSGAVAVISDALWRRRFGSEPGAVGRSVTLNGGSFTIVGVLPPDAGLPDADVWVPLAVEPFALTQRGARSLTVVGRLRPGATLEQARAELHAIAGRTSAAFPASAGWDVAVVPLKDRLVAGVRPTLLLLWAAVGFVLLIACANLANLMVARAMAREQEMALRTALGAGRGRLVRQLLTESVLVALAGGAAGLLLAGLGVESLLRLSPSLPRTSEVGVDGAVLVFTLALSIAAGLGFGLVPAWHAATTEPGRSLKEGGRATEGKRLSAFRSAAVASEVALALMLLFGAGLLVRSLTRLQAVDPGFQSSHVLTMSVSLPGSRYGEESRKAQFFGQLLDRVARLPGVAAAGVVSHLPLAGRGLNADVRADHGPETSMLADYVSATPGYFRAMGIPLLAGRQLGEGDGPQSPPVVVISDRLARRLWPGQDPVGRRVAVGASIGADTSPRVIVGVVGDVRASGLESEPGAAVYAPFAQNAWPTMSVVVRSSADPVQLAAAVRRQVLAQDPDQPVYAVRTLDDVLGASLASRRVQMLLLGAFALAALALAAVGVYGVVAQTVRRRTHEIGVRVALGAQRRDVLRLVVGRGMRPVGIGVLAGGVAAAATGRLLRGLLYGVTPADPTTFVAAAIFLAVIALVACVLPARRAVRVDPVVALRSE